MHRLKGEKGTDVKLGVLRYQEKKVRHFTVTRDEIRTKSVTSYYKEAVMSGLLLQYSFEYTDQHRDVLSEMYDESDLEAYLKKQRLVDQFATYADTHGLQRRNLMIQKSHALLERFITARIIYNLLDEEALLQYQNQSDPAIKESLRLFKDNAAFPQVDEEE